MESFLQSVDERQPCSFTRSRDAFHAIHINTLSGTRDRLERVIDGSGLVKSHLLSQQMGERAVVTCGVADPFRKFTHKNIILALFFFFFFADFRNSHYHKPNTRGASTV